MKFPINRFLSVRDIAQTERIKVPYMTLIKQYVRPEEFKERCIYLSKSLDRFNEKSV